MRPSDKSLLRRLDSFWDAGAFRTARNHQKAFKMVTSSRVQKRENEEIQVDTVVFIR
jgi:hypothetical protein